LLTAAAGYGGAMVAQAPAGALPATETHPPASTEEPPPPEGLRLRAAGGPQ
jgi:hypothetical protein